MKLATAFLFLIPLAAAGPAIQTAEVLPDLAAFGEGGYSLGHGEALQLAARVCPAKFPRKCPAGNFCCRTKKCCKKECCKNAAKCCSSAGRCRG
ncbi:hypothetical protein F53441_12987 [Fusarium austroafricanum]|uniref:Uncharacterized protein n=1 Tax=Fusarium austroafricanum TaxID=2364996 RepID=A0A8H4JU22_9HYPO|nr:hypothetical protein F53441_12987 [Fusarium austroafricanum]